MPSIFSRIAAGEIPSYKVAENEHFLAFLDINPMAKGHVLVVPKQEIDYFFDIDDNQLKKMIIFSKQVALAIKSVTECKRVGVMVVGFDVPHAHIHLIPINDSSDMNMSKPRLNLTREEFGDIAQKIQSAVDNL